MKTPTFRQVAHLYLGCFIDTKEGVGNMHELCVAPDSVEPITSHNLVYCYLKFEDVKPILRPMSDMTPEEYKEYVRLELNATTIAKDVPEIQSRAYSPASLVYLLSRGFDLFGLIDSEEALDATKLTENPYR